VAVHGDRHAAGLFGDDEGDRVAFLADPERRAVPRAQLPSRVRRARQREEAAGRPGPVTLDDDGAVVERRLRQEDRLEQIRRHDRIERHAELDVVAKAARALEHDQGADAAAGQRVRRLHELLDDVGTLGGARAAEGEPEPALADSRQRPPQLGLEEHDERDGPE